MNQSSSDGPPDVPSVEDRFAKPLPDDPVPRVEPLSKYGNPSSYVVFGKRYHTLPTSRGFVQRGIASWYGKKFHGRRTSSGETYDMYAMTAAHTQLPLPTYVQVTNLKNGKQVVLRVNDRGPFHGNRIIDLSYSAAYKLGIVQEGTGLVEVRALDPRNYQLSQNRELNKSSNTKIESTSETATHPEIMSEENVEKTSNVVKNQEVYVEEDSGITELDATTVSDTGPQVFVQVGAFGEYENANLLKNQLNGLNMGDVIISSVVINTKQLHRVRLGPLTTVQSADDAITELNAMGLSGHHVVIE